MDASARKLVPVNQYDVQKARWKASIRWLLSKVHLDNADPNEFFYSSDKGELLLDPSVEAGLVSSELYWHACSTIFNDTYDLSLKHAGAIQLLLRRGFCLGEEFENLNEMAELLTLSSPICQAAHLSLIDMIMSAFSAGVASVERVVKAVRKFATFSASSELPLSTESALVFWINKCCATFVKRHQMGEGIILSGLHDISDCRCLALTISLYRPNNLLPEDISLLGNDVAYCMHNMQQVEQFCLNCLPASIFHLSFSDLFYVVDDLLPNIVAFLADLFHGLETLGFDSPRSPPKVPQLSGGTIITVAGSSSKQPVVIPAISEATKRSFHPITLSGSTVNVETPLRTSPLSSNSVPHQHLLPKRQITGVTTSVAERGETDLPQCREAWPSRPQTRCSPTSNQNLLSNVDIDASLDLDTADLGNRTRDSTAESVDCPSVRYIDSYSEPKRAATDVLSAREPLQKTTASFVVEPLQPAKLRPAKEKSNFDSKRTECGETLTSSQKFAAPKNLDADADSDSTTPSDGYKTPVGNNSPQRDVAASHKFSYTDVQEPVINEIPTSSDDSARKTGLTTHVAPRSGEDVENVTRNAGDMSDDQELRKLQSDAFNKEFIRAFDRSTSLDQKLEGRTPPAQQRTSFAKLRKWKERNSVSIEHTPSIYEQLENNQPRQEQQTKSVVMENPAQMTWLEAAKLQRSASERNVFQAVEGVQSNSAGYVVPSQMAGLRLKLEERRRMIESGKRRAEIQRNQMQHQIGQEAFVQMIRKKDPRTPDARSLPIDNHRNDMNAQQQVMAASVVPGGIMMNSQRSRAATDFPDNSSSKGPVIAGPVATGLYSNSANVESSQRNVQPVQAGTVDVLGSDITMAPRSARLSGTLEGARNQSVKEGVNSPSAVAAIRHGSAGVQRTPLAASEGVRGSSSLTQSETSSSPRHHLPLGRLRPDLGDMAFDRLSSSLSDLQAEIVRLTAQQDEIRSLVNNSGMVASGPAGNRAPSDRGPFYLFPGNDPRSTGMLPQGVQPPSQGIGGSNVYPHGVATQQAPYHPAAGYDVDPRIYSTNFGSYSMQQQASYPSPPAPSGSGTYDLANSSHTQPYHSPSVRMQTQYQTNPSVPPYQPQYVNSPYGPGVGQWAPTPPGQQPSFYLSSPRDNRQLQPVDSSPRAVDVVKGNDILPTETVLQPVSSARAYVPPPAVVSPDADPEEQTAMLAVSKPKTAEMLAKPPETPVVPVTSATSFFVDVKSKPAVSPSSHGSHPSTPRAEGFFVSLDSLPNVAATTATAAGSGGGGSKSTAADTNSMSSSPPLMNNASFVVDTLPNTAVSSQSRSDNLLSPAQRAASSSSCEGVTDASSGQPTPPAAAGSVLSPADASNVEALAVAPAPVVFVIGTDDDVAESPSDIEKRRQKFSEQQAKRREEQEQRRIALEMELAKKREAQKSKLEEDEKKRNEDKTRRDAIFQKYMRRKQAVDGSPEPDMSPAPNVASTKATPTSAQVIMRKKHGSARHSRPMSQPPPATGPVVQPNNNLKAVEMFVSNENLLDAEALSYMTRSSDHLTVMAGGRDLQMAGQQLSHGGVTHRRPQTPDRSPMQTTLETGSSSGSLHQEAYTGPKLYVKPSLKSNRSIITNAISHCCLAGVVNKELKEKVLEELARSNAAQFIILFRDAGMQYRALYSYNADDTAVGGEILLTKLHGTGPRQLSSKVMEKFFKYNSGAKSFTEVMSTKHLTATIDAVTVFSSVWMKNRPAAATGTPASGCSSKRS